MGTARYYPSSFNSRSAEVADVRNLAYMAVTVAVVSALSVFFLLCTRDYSFLFQAARAEHAVSVSRHTAAPAAFTAIRNNPAPPAMPERTAFTLTRSRHYQRVGEMSIGIWRIDAKRGYYDLSVMLNGRRFNGKHVGLNQPVSIGGELKLVVNRIARNQISGYIEGATR